jgi:hypothetical protein
MEVTQTGLQKAITTAGGLAEMAGLLRVTQRVLRKWLTDEGAVVPEVAPRAEHNGAIDEAIRAAGSVTALAKELGVSHQAVGVYQRQGWMPAPRAQQVELRYGISRARLVSPKLRNAMGVGGDL